MSDFSLHTKESNFLFRLISPPTVLFDTFYFCDIEGGAEYLGNYYQYLPHVVLKKLSYTISGATTTPTITIGDSGGIIGAWVKSYDNLTNFTLALKRIKQDNLANQNPIYQTPFEEYKIAKKINHIPGQSISFKLRRLASLNSQIPGRLLHSTCSWKQYKGEGCNYVPGRMFDAANNPVYDVKQDICGLNLDACRLRGNTANFSGVPTIDNF